MVRVYSGLTSKEGESQECGVAIPVPVVMRNAIIPSLSTLVVAIVLVVSEGQ